MKSKSQHKREESLKEETLQGEPSSGLVQKPIRVSKQVTLEATKNHFKPAGEFVGEGTKIKVGCSESEPLINSGNWRII